MRQITAGREPERHSVRAEERRLRRRLRQLDAAISMTESDLPPDQRAREIADQMRERESVRVALHMLATLPEQPTDEG